MFKKIYKTLNFNITNDYIYIYIYIYSGVGNEDGDREYNLVFYPI